ncbi:MAG: zinc ribbon domain-containing protein [Planctomycetes bacterium]|nr:zinc ribbon domain-containing protein [Planctomycetota bacterium]
MPMYEYASQTPEADGTTQVIELLRPMSQADAPVEDPEGRGRIFKRVLSTTRVMGSVAGSGSGSAGGRGGGGCCPCGKGAGTCSRKA